METTPVLRPQAAIPTVRAVVVAVLIVVAMSATPAAGQGPSDAAQPFVLRVPVLMYHRISVAPTDAAYPGLWVAPARFRLHLALLKRHGWSTVTAGDVARQLRLRTPFPPKRFVISIDDGALDGYTHAAPILEELGMRATFFVNPGRMWMRSRMDWQQVRTLAAAGHEIANHTYRHADLTAISGVILQRRIERAQELIEQHVGQRPVTLCYPYGRHDAESRAAVRAAGIRLAFTTAYGARESTSDRMRAPRIRVNGWDGPASILARVQPYAAGH